MPTDKSKIAQQARGPVDFSRTQRPVPANPPYPGVRSFTDNPDRAGAINPQTGQAWEYVAPDPRTAGPPPGPKPSEEELDYTRQLLQMDFSDRDKFSQKVIGELDADPFAIDPAEEVEKAMGQLPEIFDQTFGGQISWNDRKRLSPQQAEHWNKVVDNYRTWVFNRALGHKQALRDQYDMAMQKFDKERAAQQAIMEKMEQRQFDRQKLEEERRYQEEQQQVAWDRADKQAADELSRESKEDLNETLSTGLKGIADMRAKIADLQRESAEKAAESAAAFENLGTPPNKKVAAAYQNKMNEMVREVARRGETLAQRVIEHYSNLKNPTQQDELAADQLLQRIVESTRFAFETTAVYPGDVMPEGEGPQAAGTGVMQ